jgi:hypothetical protein
MKGNILELMIMSFLLGMIWGLGSMTLIIQNFYKQGRSIFIKQETPKYYLRKELTEGDNV